jgi:hypothetical protein
MRRIYTVLLALVALGTIIGTGITLGIPSAQPPEASGHDKAVAFIETVLPIDASQYNITFQPPLSSEPILDNKSQIETYSLEANSSSLTFICSFYDDKLYQCQFGVNEGSITTDQPYANASEAAKSFLEKYQDYSGLDSTAMIAMLVNVDPTKNATVTSGDLKLTVTHYPDTGTAFGDSINFRWVRIINGCEYLYINAGFTNGVFSGFIDHRARYSIGDTAVGISREQAVKIALDAIGNYSYRMSDDWVVTGFNVTENRAVAVLQPQTEEGSVLCPAWSVTLPLNGTWPGSVTELLVGIWAGTGEVYLVHHQAYAQLYPNSAIQ